MTEGNEIKWRNATLRLGRKSRWRFRGASTDTVDSLSGNPRTDPRGTCREKTAFKVRLTRSAVCDLLVSVCRLMAMPIWQPHPVVADTPQPS